MELKIEDLKVGDELECVDKRCFLDVDKESRPAHQCILAMNKIKVLDIVDNFIEIENDNEFIGKAFHFDYVKYFKKKDPQPTFNDLIDVAVRARKDGKISNLFISDTFMEFSHGDHMYDHGITCVKSGINYIQSLYKETFVIECEEDMKRIKDDALITLQNGEILDYKDAIGLESYINSFILKLLKGATVTQSK